MATSPAAAMDDGDLLAEILLRLPPLPSSLPRASLVCTRWCRLLSSPTFLRRFRARHSNPPLLGVFSSDLDGDGAPSFTPIMNPYDQLPSFTPILNPPDRIPSSRFSYPLLHRDERCRFMGCRHGLLLLQLLNFNPTRLREVVVWDPVSGDQRRFALPPWFGGEAERAAVLRRSGHANGQFEFKVVLLRTNDVSTDHDPRVFAAVYDSEVGVWSNLVSASIRLFLNCHSSVMVGNSLYWALLGDDGASGILEFDLDKESLAVIDYLTVDNSSIQILRTEDSRLGLAVLSEVSNSIQIWEKKDGIDGVARWTLQKTIELNMLLSLRSPMERYHPMLQGHDEDDNALFVKTAIGVFMINLKSMQFRNLFYTKFFYGRYHPYRSLCISGPIGSGDDGAESLNN